MTTSFTILQPNQQSRHFLLKVDAGSPVKGRKLLRFKRILCWKMKFNFQRSPVEIDQVQI